MSFSGFALTGVPARLGPLAGRRRRLLNGLPGGCGGTYIPFDHIYGVLAPGLVRTPEPRSICSHGQSSPDGVPHRRFPLSRPGPPPRGDTADCRLVLPALTIAYGAIAVILRFVRNTMLEVMSLRPRSGPRPAKGVPEQHLVRRHADATRSTSR